MREPFAKQESPSMEQLRYPIGNFHQSDLTPEGRKVLIDEIAELPGKVRIAVADLSEDQLETPYRPGGWTIRQVVHHLPDSHMNAYLRFKFALTESEPTIKPYDEASWAELPDALAEEIETSLILLEMLHRRWCRLLRSLVDEQFARGYFHPEMGRVPLEVALQLYAWHGRHHLAHIRLIGER